MSFSFSMTKDYSLTLIENEGNYQVMLTSQDEIMYEALDKALKTVRILNNQQITEKNRGQHEYVITLTGEPFEHIEPRTIFQYHRSVLQQPEKYSNNKMPNLENILRQ